MYVNRKFYRPLIWAKYVQYVNASAGISCFHFYSFKKFYFINVYSLIFFSFFIKGYKKDTENSIKSIA